MLGALIAGAKCSAVQFRSAGAACSPKWSESDAARNGAGVVLFIDELHHTW